MTSEGGRFRLRWAILLPALILLLGFLFILAVSWGRYPEPGFLSLKDIREDALARSLVLRLRLPRALMAVALGVALGGAGSVLQTVLGNPLVEPGLLGVSQGSAFGAALAILLGGGALSISATAAIFGLAGLAFSWLLARRIRYGGSILRLILSGIVVSALFSSGLGVLKVLADPRSELPEITFWLMGGLSSTDWAAVTVTLPVVAVVALALSAMKWRINLLALDDRSAFAMGARPGRERLILVVLAVLAVAAVTAEAGIVSWAGLLVPHIARRFTGSDSARSLPASMLFGGAFVLLCDTAARGMTAAEIPLGLLTSLVGAVLFAFLMTLKEKTP